MFLSPLLPHAQSIFGTGGIPTNQRAISDFIAQKRRAQNLTQEQLSETLGVSNKAISKWENGKSMPDYSIIQDLCSALHVTLPELVDGKDAPENNTPTCDDERILDLIRHTHELGRQKNVLFGLILIVLGIACGALPNTTGGTNVLDFISGILLVLSVAEILIGIWIAGKHAFGK